MTDRELLEAAARAAGYEIEEWQGPYPQVDGGNWHPLSDDGDALRLAVKLNMELDLCVGRIAVRITNGIKVLQEVKDCRELATRRAIVRAAAAMLPKDEGK